ncbi:hypothetical protein QR680_013453 [Steinernema hermaphroditum]|uniref:Elongin-C n=1 Tax=Steinernema hermaphroditum TaxID=289476 RepID=A0AA39I7W1_9BILA|nr:hypothetical protein QR680_013453 [Steinernema hermaphroditum]
MSSSTQLSNNNSSPTKPETTHQERVDDSPASLPEERTFEDPVTLISAEGEEVVIEREHAMISGTLRNMLLGPRDGDSTVHLPCIPRHILEIVSQYLEYNHANREVKEPVDFDVPSEHAKDIMLAAHFLDC